MLFVINIEISAFLLVYCYLPIRFSIYPFNKVQIIEIMIPRIHTIPEKSERSQYTN